jgi:thimet oligopeptidase
MVGFKNFAELDLDSNMVKKLSTAEDFLNQLAARSKKKAEIELVDFLKDLPNGIALDSSGKLQPWNFNYIKSCYKKKHFEIDEREVAKYFPVDKTLNSIFEIYQNFLGLKFEISKPEWAWHEDVLLIKVYDAQPDYLSKANQLSQKGRLRGYLFIDLYPRENKYSHAGCCVPMIPTQIKSDGKIVPAVLAIIANFPKAQKDRPALLKFNDVNTFFHEFGHAMHDVLGATQMAGFAGTSVKTDFVEVPSQMFEEWMADKSVLKKLSSHYQTSDPLPDELIDKLIQLKKFDSGNFILRQCCLSFVSLEFFKDGKIKNPDQIIKNLFSKYQPHLKFDDQTHFYASFGHLVGYGAKYYSYMWSKVFSLDLFYDIKKRGLFDPEIGKEFAAKVLSKGGSVDPEKLLQDFLGRKPNQNAFLKDLGIE